MRKSLFFMLMIGAGEIVNGQTTTVLQHAGATTAFYTNTGLQDAYTASQNGDTIYLPGGFFNPPALVDKQLTIIGAGHHPDSSSATAITVIQGTINIGENADNLQLQGFKISGDISIAANLIVNNLLVKRVMLNRLYILGNRSNPCINGSFRECIFNGEIQLSNASLFTITNSFIQYRIMYGYNSVINNNIFLSGDANCCPWTYISIYYCNQCVIKNNIFYRVLPGITDCSNNQFQNNVFTNTPDLSNNVLTGNFYNVTATSIFSTYADDLFSYGGNFHLQNPALYMGTDATQVGIYGTSAPFKEGAMPVNPHIQTKNIAQTTDANGLIQVQIKVTAQNQ